MTLSAIGAGFGRTGTMSLKLALEQLGLGPCYHMAEVFKNPAAPDWWYEVAQDPAKADWGKIFEGYNSTVDWPNATYWEELAEAYPDAKVILTERDPNTWFDSTQATIFADRGPSGPGGRLPADGAQGGLRPVRRAHPRPRDHAISRSSRLHNARVRAAIPAERLLVYEVADGWEPLCDFLGVQVPGEPMPKVNTREQFGVMAAGGGVPPGV